MLSNASKKKILELAVRNRISGKEVFVQDDYRQDCQIVMPDKYLLAVFDFKEALLNASRFKPISYSVLDLVLNFSTYEAKLMTYDAVYPHYSDADVTLFRFQDAEGQPVYVQKKLLALLGYDPDDTDHVLYHGAKGFVFYFDTRNGDVDAILPPFRIKEVNDGTKAG